MTKLFRSLVLFLTSLLAVSILAGCGDIDDTDEPVPVNFVSATPTGGVIGPNVWIRVAFDNSPTDVTVSAGTVTVAGKTATIAGPFTPGPLALTLTWADGTQRLIFTVSAPCCSPAYIVGGTVEDGDTNVDSELINSNGKIVIEFTEAVTGNIVLQTEDGDNVGWLGKVKGSKGTLELVKGRELVNETVYVIAGQVSTIEGNATDFKITFVTKGKA